MKKIFSVLLMCVFVIMAGCGVSKNNDLQKYIKVEYSGLSSLGTAVAWFDADQAGKDIFKYKDGTELTEKKREELQEFINSVQVELDRASELKNGDKIKVKVNVNKELSEVGKAGEYEFEVSGLEEPQKITAEDVKKHVVVNFVGFSGRGSVKIDTTFKENALNRSIYTVENDGKLKNGDKVNITMSEEDRRSLLVSSGFLFDESSEVVIEVKGLEELAENAKDIANYADLQRMLGELKDRNYNGEHAWRKYETVLEGTYYRQFEDSDGNNYFSSNGHLVNVYTVKEVSDGKELSKQTVLLGFTNLVIDENKKVNVSKLKETSYYYDSTYSLESVKQILEGQGYTVVK